MKIGTEDRKKLIIAGSLGAVALISILYMNFSGGSGDTTPSTTPPPVVTTTPPRTTAVPIAHVPASTDPSLHPEAMLLTESLVYSGRGRNIFGGVSEQPVVAVVKAPVKLLPPAPVVATAPVNLGPPPPPPINLRFFGTVTSATGKRQAMLLQGDDVFIAGTGDVVARKYRVGEVTLTSVEVTDLSTNNKQRLPVSVQ